MNQSARRNRTGVRWQLSPRCARPLRTRTQPRHQRPATTINISISSATKPKRIGPSSPAVSAPGLPRMAPAVIVRLRNAAAVFEVTALAIGNSRGRRR
jgi:hypothetical protein